MKTSHTSVCIIASLGLCMSRGLSQTAELNLHGGAGTQSPAINLHYDDGGSPPNPLYQHSTFLADLEGLLWVTMSSNHILTQWNWFIPNGNGMSFYAPDGYLVVKNGTGLAELSGSGRLRLKDSNGHEVELTIQPPQQIGAAAELLINGQKALTINEGDTRYLSSSWSSSILTQASADTRYLRTDSTRLQFGSGANAMTEYSSALGWQTYANGKGATAIGSGDSTEVAFYDWTGANGKGSTAIGYGVLALNEFAVAMGSKSMAQGRASVAVGYGNTTGTAAEGAVSMGLHNNAMARGAVSLGGWSVASNEFAVTIGFGNQASGINAISIGHENIASGDYALATGQATQAPGRYAASFGNTTLATGTGAVAMGEGSQASATGALAFGRYANASDQFSLAGGLEVKAEGWTSTALGHGTVAKSRYQVVLGAYNIPTQDADANVKSASDGLLILGNGNSTTPSNALVVRWNGDTEASGTIRSTATGEGKYNKFKAPILVPQSGDIGMGEFTAGEQPFAPGCP